MSNSIRTKRQIRKVAVRGSNIGMYLIGEVMLSLIINELLNLNASGTKTKINKVCLSIKYFNKKI